MLEDIVSEWLLDPSRWVKEDANRLGYELP